MVVGASSNTSSQAIVDWATSTAYIVGQYVQTGSILYKCIIAHTSGTFATDLLATKWVEMNDQAFTIAMALVLG